MPQVKLPYYRITVPTHVTHFGVPEVECKNLYDKAVPDKVIVRVDNLNCLRGKLDDSCFICREILYNMLAGNKDYQTILMSYYRKFQSFRILVNDAYYYGDDTIPIVERVLLPLRQEINEFAQKTSGKLKDAGGKYLVLSHDYLFYAFHDSSRVPEIEGAKYVC